ncbi:MAG: undecaprenyldiphospho-muramoylpentapeptide beta-N-acetylglucosaminyltransferase [Bacteroides sp.]|nr:undecaprenyldiphospho-muramoylpentapeptide beta-N-acetylglucosaminyltransferase [Bacteroides sp.]MCM1413766.1 undecaprenyldiphospho-muramoylpentapeptide beta-N-acetylglucosaminyltransferase [Bacteroides sp.]MCM1472215.1 undecaprenyldiphospho-muramoylpentapeptide beta-N-acetylglucosaminyltransferase [Bacteroides sp.]
MSKQHKSETEINRPMRVLVSGGGTGGHIFPAVAIANAVRRRHPDAEILFVGALGRMEMERVPAAGYEIVGLPIAGFDRRRIWRNFAVMVKLIRSMRKARKVLREFKPDIAIGVGGYASGPMLKEAQRRGIPTLLQEQNSYAGVTNKLLARKAKAICVAYEGMDRFFPADSIVMTGNPVRYEIATADMDRRKAKAKLGFDPDRKLLVVVGGSLGACTINDSIGASLDKITDHDIQILWQTGKLYADECAATASGKKDVKAMAFISDMATAYRAADLIVARAGAGTISELQLLGLPAILVPSPNVAEDHQRKNAQALVDHDAAVIVLDADARTRLADTVIDLMADSDRRDRLADNVGKMALRGSDEAIVDTIERVLSNLD